ncbi:3-oxoacyl-[acyl-carrier-protein] reductase [Candidatus Poribacteria bacterium]
MVNQEFAIVTGGSRGIGRATALTLSKEGVKVCITYLKEEEKALEVQRLTKNMKNEAIVLNVDVREYLQVDSMVNELYKRFGRIDILVNNVGITKDKIFHKMTREEWDEVISTDLHGVFNCTRAVVNIMRGQKRGRIVNISSVIGQTGNIGQCNYAAAKAGLIGFTKSLAKESARLGITVNAIAPGFIETDMLSSIPDSIKEEYLKTIPMERFGKPEEVAELVLFLVRDADYITGQVININGGLYM